MAEVWEGIDDVLTRPVAVKILYPHLAANESFLERFRREAVAAARLSHPNVVATFDTGEDGDAAFIVMELVRGRTLRSMIDDEGGSLPPALARDIGIQVARALHHAHQSGLVHRDVKPANILICDSEPGLPVRVKVADFGIAHAATEDGGDLTQPGALMGTAKYLSPEQVEGREPTARSDVYALGVVLYEVLTGRAPFSGETDLSTAMAHVHGELLRPRQIRAGIPRALEAVVLRAMARDPLARYASASDLAGALQGVDLGDDAVPAVVRDPTPPAGVAPSFSQTERSWLVPAAVIVAAAVALLVVAVVLSRSDVGPNLLRRPAGTDAAALSPVALSGARSFDPQGQPPVENEERTGAVLDGDPSTTWRTDRYNTRAFGGLKNGLGIIVDLGADADVRRVKVASDTTGWSARIYVGTGDATDLAGWGEAVAEHGNIDGNATFELGEKGHNGRSVLVWLTKLGEDNRVTISAITVEA